MLVYINKVYLKESLISYLQIIIHDEINLKNIYYTDTYEAVVNKCRDLKNKGYNVYPLKTDRFEIDINVDKIRIDDNSVVEVGTREERFIDTVYSLYSMLAKQGAVLFSEEFPYEDGYVGLLSEFTNLTISNKNMEVSLPVVYGDKCVYELKLISQEGNVIYNNKFKVAIPKKNVHNFYRYNLVEIGEITLNNNQFIIMEYLKELTIFRLIDFIDVPEPIIVRYVSAHDFYSDASSLISSLLEVLNISQIYRSVNTKLSFSDLFNNYSGVFLRSSHRLNQSDLDELVKIILSVGPSLIGKRNTDPIRINSAILEILNSKGLPLRYSKIIMLVLSIYKFSSNNLDVVNSLMSNFNSIKLILLDIDLYLYNMRLNIFINSKELYPNSSQVKLSSYNNSVKMEIWRK